MGPQVYVRCFPFFFQSFSFRLLRVVRTGWVAIAIARRDTLVAGFDSAYAQLQEDDRHRIASHKVATFRGAAHSLIALALMLTSNQTA